MRKLIKKITHPFFKFIYEQRFSRPRKYVYENIEVIVQPNVFPPHFTLSTKILLNYIKPIDLKDKTVLELGCGSGIISLLASSKGATVTASDINKTALSALNDASEKNKLKVQAIYSDLFTNIKKLDFDYILINPPYYPKNAKNIKEKAWYCGENFEYFEKLFYSLSQRSDKTVLIILSEDCNINRINEIASKYKFILDCIHEKTVMAERNYIFSIN